MDHQVEAPAHCSAAKLLGELVNRVLYIEKKKRYHFVLRSERTQRRVPVKPKHLPIATLLDGGFVTIDNMSFPFYTSDPE